MSPPQLFAFVLMPFAKKLRNRYIRIQSAACEAGMRAERVDDQHFYRRGIVERIHRQIESADFIIADMSKPNPNVFYEVGYAHAKHKLCILLTNNVDTIPFDLKHLPHIVFSSLKDLGKQLSAALEVLKSETELFFDKGDPECFHERIPISKFGVVGTSTATSIRVRVRANVELQPKNVTADITKIEKSSHRGWQEIKLPAHIRLTWTDNTIFMDFSESNVKYVNVLHIDHSDNKITIWGVPPSLFEGFFDEATTYRITVSALARQYAIEVDWKGQWETIQVRPAVRSRRVACVETPRAIFR